MNSGTGHCDGLRDQASNFLQHGKSLGRARAIRTACVETVDLVSWASRTWRASHGISIIAGKAGAISQSQLHSPTATISGLIVWSFAPLRYLCYLSMEDSRS